MINKSPFSWFWRGMLVGILLSAALTGLSYFFRSGGWRGLLPGPYEQREALGFPLECWEAGNSYGGFYVDYPSLALNLVFGIGVGAILGALVWTQRRTLNRLVDEFELRVSDRSLNKLQFSLRGLLVAILLCGVCAAMARTFTR